MFVLLVLALVGGVTVGLIRGGTLNALARVHVLRPWTFVAAVTALLMARLVPSLHGAGWVAAAVGVAVFAAANSRLPGVGLLLAGITLNAVVIMTNDGQMPVSLWGAERAGIAADEVRSSALHSPAGTDTVLRPATAVIPIPFPNAPAVVSVGDVLVASGFGLFGAVAPVRARRTLEARRARDLRWSRLDEGPAEGPDGFREGSRIIPSGAVDASPTRPAQTTTTQES